MYEPLHGAASPLPASPKGGGGGGERAGGASKKKRGEGLWGLPCFPRCDGDGRRHCAALANAVRCVGDRSALHWR